MLNRMFQTAREKSDFLSGPYFYGYPITAGLGGERHIKEFRNVQPAAKGLAEQSRLRETLFDTTLDEKENRQIITAEMPGVSKQDIRVTVSENTVIIHAENGDKRYHTEIPSSAALDEKPQMRHTQTAHWSTKLS